jgi:hypothetical protein
MNMYFAKGSLHLRIVYAAIAMFLSILTQAYGDDLDTQQKALNYIADYADRTCSKIPLEGSSKDVRLSAEGRADLNEFLKKFADIGGGASIVSRDIEYQGVLQKQLADSIKDSSNCKLNVLKILREKMLPSPKSDLSKSKPDFAVRVDKEDGIYIVNEGGDAENIGYDMEARVLLACSSKNINKKEFLYSVSMPSYYYNENFHFPKNQAGTWIAKWDLKIFEMLSFLLKKGNYSKKDTSLEDMLSMSLEDKLSKDLFKDRFNNHLGKKDMSSFLSKKGEGMLSEDMLSFDNYEDAFDLSKHYSWSSILLWPSLSQSKREVKKEAFKINNNRWESAKFAMRLHIEYVDINSVPYDRFFGVTCSLSSCKMEKFGNKFYKDFFSHNGFSGKTNGNLYFSPYGVNITEVAEPIEVC